MTEYDARQERERVKTELRALVQPNQLGRALRTKGALWAVARAALPLVGVAFLGWSAVEVLAYYFLETIVIGLFNVPKLFAAPAGGAPPALFLSLFFFVHYGMFVGIQGVFVFVAPGDAVRDEALALLHDREALLALLAAVGWEAADHVSWLRSERPDRGMQMFMPYPRIVVQQFVAIIGSWGIFFLQGAAASTWSLVVLVVVRFVVDGLVAPSLSGALGRAGLMRSRTQRAPVARTTD